jgi:protein required for attachment to host cells
MTAWILVGDASRAKLFAAELREDDWSLVKDFEHPEAREPGREIGPQAPPGRMLKSKTPGGRHTALEAHTSPKEVESERFARQLGTYLEDAVARRQFDYLVLVAPPHFLGVLKNALGQQAAKHLRSTVDKDLSTVDAAELRKRLIDDVFPRHAGSP